MDEKKISKKIENITKDWDDPQEDGELTEEQQEQIRRDIHTYINELVSQVVRQR